MRIFYAFTIVLGSVFFSVSMGCRTVNRANLSSADEEQNADSKVNGKIAEVAALAFLDILKGEERYQPDLHRQFLAAELQKRALTLGQWDNFNQTIINHFANTSFSLVSDETLSSFLEIEKDKSAWIRLYYNVGTPKLQIYEGEGLEIFRSIVSFVSYERNKQRIEYYKTSIKNKTVPVMAAELNRPEASVYRDLWEHRLYINNAWDIELPVQIRAKVASDQGLLGPASYFDAASTLYVNRGQKISEIASLLEVSPDSLEDIFHHRGLLRKAVRWSTEEERALRLLYPDRTIAELSAILGRTSASISKRVQQLGLHKFEVNYGKPNIEIAPYGQIKKDGNLIEASVEALLKDHLFTPATIIAEMLDVSEATIRTYRRRFALPYMSEAQAFKLNEEAYKIFEERRQRTREEQQLKVINQEIARYIETSTEVMNGELITARTIDQILGLRYDRLVGQGSYAKNNSYVFASVIEHWLAFDTGIQSRIAELQANGDRTSQQDGELNVLVKFTFFEIQKLQLDTYPEALRNAFNEKLERDRPKFQQQFS